MRLFLALCAITFSASSVFSQEYKRMIEAETYSVQEIIDNAEAYFENRSKGKGTGYKQFKRWEYNALRLMNEDGYLRTIAETRAEFKRQEAYLNETANTRGVLNDNWQELGPTSMQPHTSWSPGLGRITSIAVAGDDTDHILVGAETGGVWKSTDGGQNWASLTDYFNNLYVYSLVIDQSNSDVYYFGSSGGDVYKSEDQGATWNLLSTIANSSVNKILLHPTDSNIMYASVANQGVYRSADAGLTWTEISNATRGYDIEFKPGDPSVVYASGENVYKSTDNGVTFTQLTGFTTGAKMMAVTPANPDVLFITEALGARFGALYKSEDGGLNFTQLADSSINYFGLALNGIDTFGQAPRDMDIVVSPVDENEVHLGGGNTWMSLDGGLSFDITAHWLISSSSSENIGYCHADVDILLFVGTDLYAGTDGGIFKAEDTQNITSDYYTDLSSGMGIKQLYKIGVAQGSEVMVSGGSQDNGTSVYREDDGWRDWLGADGMETFILDNTNYVFGTSQYGTLYRSVNGSDTYGGLNEPGVGQGNWVTPFEKGNDNAIYVAYDQVYKSTTYGNTWQSVSQSYPTSFNNLKLAPSDNQVMYATRGANIYRTTDGGATDWEQMTTPGGGISSVAVHPADPYKVVVTTASSLNVFVSTDGAETWAVYKKNLPNFSALSVIWDHNGRDGIYLGMDYGIYYIDNDLEEWVPYNTNLPNVIVNELDINTETRTLYAGTYGRGTWFSPMFDSTLGVDAITAETLQVYPNPAANEINLRLPVASVVDVRIFDVQGALLSYYKDVQIDGEHALDISGLRTGVYFMRVASDNGTITKKFIKE
ncbi:glycosyl hydrolase [unidentified eubacterium SCB49]|nr:glycosyl hydrolase [unidentified eubacterium SCB49]